MKITFKIIYWSLFAFAITCSGFLLIKMTNTNIFLLVLYSIIAIIGYFTQEKINKWMGNKIFGIFKVDKVELPQRILKYRAFLFGVAITAFWASIGIDLSTSFISGVDAIPATNIPLFDLSLFLMVMSIIPEVIWLFNYGVNDKFILIIFNNYFYTMNKHNKPKQMSLFESDSQNIHSVSSKVINLSEYRTKEFERKFNSLKKDIL